MCDYFSLKISTKLVTGRLPRRHTHTKKSNKHRHLFTCDVTLESTLFVNRKIITCFPKKTKQRILNNNNYALRVSGDQHECAYILFPYKIVHDCTDENVDFWSTFYS